jgi:hypothetical protein
VSDQRQVLGLLSVMIIEEEEEDEEEEAEKIKKE